MFYQSGMLLSVARLCYHLNINLKVQVFFLDITLSSKCTIFSKSYSRVQLPWIRLIYAQECVEIIQKCNKFRVTPCKTSDITHDWPVRPSIQIIILTLEHANQKLTSFSLVIGTK